MCPVKKVFLKISGRASFFIKKETLAQVFSCEFCEIFKNALFYRTLLEILQKKFFGEHFQTIPSDFVF